jgi:mono/diheme cytochrome c family protein
MRWLFLSLAAWVTLTDPAFAQPAGAPKTVPEMWSAWCARCHAQDGSGKVSEPTVTVEPLDFTDCRIASAEPDADWAVAITHGGPAVGLSSQMPAFGDVLTSGQVGEFVSLIRGFCRERGWPTGNLNLPRPIFT